jgi:hypothetical protein
MMKRVLSVAASSAVRARGPRVAHRPRHGACAAAPRRAFWRERAGVAPPLRHLLGASALADARAVSLAQRGAAAVEAGRLPVSSHAAALAGASQAASAGGPTSAGWKGQGARGLASAAPTAPYSFTPPGRHHLFVPGPTNVPDRVLRVMDRQSGAHLSGVRSHRRTR